MRINLNELSDQDLLDLVQELNQETFEEDSRLRILAVQYFGTESLLHILAVGSKLLPVIAERMKCYSPHIRK